MRELLAWVTVAVALCAAPSAMAADAVVALQATGINPYHEVSRAALHRVYTLNSDG